MSGSVIPSRDECYALMDHYQMFDNVRDHSLVVTRVAETLYDGLAESLPPNNLPEKELVIAGSLLHDIAKTICIKDGCSHAEVGAEICLEHGYVSTAEIVREHVILSDFHNNRCSEGKFRAKELVYYADKRVNHDQLVSLDERLDYINKRYGKGIQERIKIIEKNFLMCRDIEVHIFNNLSFSPDKLHININ